MKGLVLTLFILLSVSVTRSQSLIPDELAPLYGTNRTNGIETSESHNLKSKIYRSYHYTSDNEGIYALVFKYRNLKRLEDLLKENGLVKVYDDNHRTIPTIAYSSPRYEAIIYKKEREVVLYDLYKRPYRVVRDRFYNDYELESLRAGYFQAAPLEPRIYLDFVPAAKDVVKASITLVLDHWIHSDEIKFSINGGDQILSYRLYKVSDDVRSGFRQIEVVEESTFEMPLEKVERLLESPSVLVRVIGEKYVEFELTESQRNALKDFIRYNNGK